MKDASQYPISFPYGATDPPYGTPALPYHRGEDRAMPVGTPVVVNGVTIGLSGNTGFSTGSHLHIGRFIGIKDTPPNGGGFQFNNAVVTEINQDATNGKYVRVQADGASWVYLHLSDNSKVSVGEILQGGTVEPADYRLNRGDSINFYKEMLGRDPSEDEIKIYEGKTFKEAYYAFAGSDEFKQRLSGGVNRDSVLKYVQQNLK